MCSGSKLFVFFLRISGKTLFSFPGRERRSDRLEFFYHPFFLERVGFAEVWYIPPLHLYANFITTQESGAYQGVFAARVGKCPKEGKNSARGENSGQGWEMGQTCEEAV